MGLPRLLARPLAVSAALALLMLAVSLPTGSSAPRADAANGSWTGTYYNNITLTGSPILTRDDGATLDFTWGTGSPGSGVNADNFSVRWEHTATYAAGNYCFNIITNDGMRIFIDGVSIFNQWFDQPPTAYTVDRTITAGPHTVRVEFYEGINTARAKVEIQLLAAQGTDWNAQFYANKTLSGSPALTRTDANINFSWGAGAPGAGVPANNFSARWTSTQTFQAGVHEFTATSDDGVRVYLDGTLILNYWIDQGATTHSVNRTVTAGDHTIVVEYYDGVGNATMQFSYALNPVVGGFLEEPAVSGLDIPTAFAFAPDGRIFFAEKDGDVKIFKNGALLPTNFYTVSPVNDYHDRGLLGLALHPDFTNNPYVYLSYVYDNNPSDEDGLKTSQVIRVTANGDVAAGGSKLVLLGSVVGTPSQPSCENYATTADCIPADYDSHSIGNIRFGADGMLYVESGDGASYNTVDVRALRAQSLDRLAGKILRVNPANGQGLTDNPFYNGNLTSTRSKVWAYGLRNAFRMNFKPGTNTIFIGDVGWDQREEVNVAVAGRNFGWPCYEGTGQQSGYAAYSQCQALYSSGGTTVGVHTYDHNGNDAAVVGGGFTGTNSYPPEFQNAYWFGDYSRDEIRAFKVDASNNMVPGSMRLLTSGAGGPVQIETGPDGNVYYLSINNGELIRVQYIGGNRPPTAVALASPSSGLTPLNVNFSSTGSSDPDAGQTLTYDWDFGDGTPHSTAPNPPHTYATSGTYNARLTVTDPFGLTGTDTQVIQAGNSAPTAIIGAPLDEARYDIADVIQFSGSGDDAQDGDLSGNSLAWSIVMQHCADGTYTPSSCHPHGHFSDVGDSGEFTITDHGDFVFYEVFLTVTDSGGLTDTEKVTIRANTVNLTLQGNLAGLRITVDGSEQVTPFTRTVPRKSVHTLFANSPQTVASGTVNFQSWSDGGAQQHTITANASATYTVNFADPPTATPTPSNTPTATATPTRTQTPTQTRTSTPSSTSTLAPTNTPSPVPTNTPGGPTDTPSPTRTQTPLPSSTPSPTNTPLPTATSSLTATATATPTFTPTPSLTPKAYWAFDQASWNGTANEVVDSSSSAYHGRGLNGATTANTTPARTGNPGTCRYGTFDGVNDYVDLAQPQVTWGSAITVMAWVRWNVNPASAPSWATIVTNNSNTQGDFGQFWLQHSELNGKYEFAVQTSIGRRYVIGTVSPLQGVWQHVAGVYDGATLKVYVNGVQAGSTPVTGAIIAPQTAFKWNVGRRAFGTGGNRLFNGGIDEVRIYNRALTVPELTGVMNATHTCTIP